MKDLLSEVSELFEININTVLNDISNSSLNIYSSFRITVEELLKQINDYNNFIDEGNSFYNRIINNNDFQNYLINEYKCDCKIMAMLNKVQEKGNSVIHNKLKYFDLKDAKDTLYRILLLAKKFLEIEKYIDVPNIKIDDFISENNRKIKIEKTDKNEYLNRIKLLDESLENAFNSNDNYDTFINYFSNLVDDLINYIIGINDYNKIDDLNNSEYKKLFIIYNDTSNLKTKDLTDNTRLIEYIYYLKSIVNVLFDISIFNWFVNKMESKTDKDENLEIANAIDSVIKEKNATNQVCYVHDQYPFYINSNIYYILKLKKAINDQSRSNNIVYSKEKIPDNYAIEISTVSKEITLLNNKINIDVVSYYKVAIRPCELNKLIFMVTGKNINTYKSSNFYKSLMNYLEETKDSLLDIAQYEDNKYEEFINKIDGKNTDTAISFIEMMEKSRYLIKQDDFGIGVNVLRYFLYKLNNVEIYDQIDKYNDNKTIRIINDSLRFDRNPFSFFLKKHIQRLEDLYNCFDCNYYKADIFARKLNDLMVKNQSLFINLDDFDNDDITNIYTYNNLLELNYRPNNDPNYVQPNKLGIIDGYVYTIDNANTLNNIKEYLLNYKNNYHLDYQNEINNYDLTNIDSNQKLNIIKNSFNNTSLLMIYGEAGTGKTELLCNYYANIFKDRKIIFASNTHNCLNNMKLRVMEKVGLRDNFIFGTIKKINQRKFDCSCDVLIIDECKSISNRDIEKLLKKAQTKYIILAGDLGQINAIDLGNWYEYCFNYFKENRYVLDEIKRTNKIELKNIWKKIRNNDEDTIDYLLNNNYLEKINKDIFKPKDDSEVILCLNYGGTYGITSINSYFQGNNPNKLFKNNLDTYKIDDPIVFNENAKNLDTDYLYNNLKGRILNIEEDDIYLKFIIKVDEYIPILDNDYVISSSKEDKTSIINIQFKKYIDNPDDDNEKDYLCPFDVSYALSIHKAQGLEYNSVKIIITPESEELINNEIFYTAVTRAKEKLKIYYVNDNLDYLKNIIGNKSNNMDFELMGKLFE